MRSPVLFEMEGGGPSSSTCRRRQLAAAFSPDLADLLRRRGLDRTVAIIVEAGGLTAPAAESLYARMSG